MADNEDNNFLGMGDDEFLEQSMQEEEPTVPAEAEPGDAESESADPEAEAPEEVVSNAEGDAEAAETTDEDAEAQGDATDAPEDPETDPETDPEEASDEDPATAAEKEGDAPSEGETHKAFYEQLTAPFKANGKEFKVDNAADAIQLMQMGVNYNKKMAALKPSLKSLRLLEKHGLLDEDKLSFLIDVDRKDPQAIAKLLADSKIDPMDIDVEKGSEYKTPTRQIDDAELALNSILDDLQESPKYGDLLDVISNKWDNASKQIIAEAPQLLNVIHDHMDSGIYELITQQVERERTFGRLQGTSDLEAYRIVGDDLHEKGAFKALLAPEQTQPPEGAPVPRREVNLNVSEKKDTSRNEKRKAASPSKSKVSKQQDNYNPLSLSDDEFMKQFNPELM